MTITVSGSTVTFTDSTTQNTAATGFGFKNRLINGAMLLNQRSVASVSGTAYPVDRFLFSMNGSNMTAAQSITAPTGFRNSVVITSNAASSIAAGDYRQFIQNIEGYNFYDFAYGTASAATLSLSFWARSSLTGTFSGGVMNSAATRSYVFTYSINSANTWEYKTVAIPGDTTGTWVTDNGVGLSLRFDLGTSSTYTTSAGSWQAGLYFKSTGSVSLCSTSGATLYFTGVQLEKGPTATTFDWRSGGTETALCQRYYCPIGFGAANGYALGGATVGGNANLKVTMRATPTFAQIADGYMYGSYNVATSTSYYLTGGGIGDVFVYRAAASSSSSQFSELFSATAELL